MKPIFVGIAGGTGAGKSTLSRAIKSKYPNVVEIIQLDNYFKTSDTIPKLAGFDNWDHPDALNFDRLISDLKAFSKGKSATTYVKNELVTPGVYETQEKKQIEIFPKPLMIVEGYLMLYRPEVRELLSKKIFLDIPHDLRWKRRIHFKINDYEKNVVIPMYKEFVEPTKQFADFVLDVTNMTPNEVYQSVEPLFLEYVI
ncbi:MAG TPA: hypothetical protein VG917_00355 [Patescibacteria group bacterium]|nr:hypothetical protein [Patescibacteria group bacterium]